MTLKDSNAHTKFYLLWERNRTWHLCHIKGEGHNRILKIGFILLFADYIT